MIVLTIEQLDSLREKLITYTKQKEEEYSDMDAQWYLHGRTTKPICTICPSCEQCCPDDDYCACDYD